MEASPRQATIRTVCHLITAFVAAFALLGGGVAYVMAQSEDVRSVQTNVQILAADLALLQHNYEGLVNTVNGLSNTVNVLSSNQTEILKLLREIRDHQD